MTHNEPVDPIDEKYGRALVDYGIRTGRNRHDLLPDEWLRYSYWKKAGCSILAAFDLMREDRIDG